MLNPRRIANRNNADLNTVLFCRKAPPNKYSFVSQKSSNESSNPQKLFLLSKYSEFSIFDVIPRNFSISTKNGTSHFNLNLLKEVSPVITTFNQENPSEMQYNLNIIDEENVLSKFEQLFQGKKVTFVEDELPSCQRITKILQIKNCPNCLKPESLRTSEIYSNGNHMYKYDEIEEKMIVEIYEDGFIEYLKSPELQQFVIKTKKNEYKCNIFGIYSSNLIRQILEKDCLKNEFEYDFDDENDEFQTICDFFNFRQVDIKSDNMDFLKEIATNLQINCIIKQIDLYINNYENFSQKVDEQQTIIDSIDNLFDLLYNINNYGIEKVKLLIAQSEWSQKEGSVQELAAFILQVVKPNFCLHREMADLLIELKNEANESNKLDKLIPFIIEKLMSYFTSESTDMLPKIINNTTNRSKLTLSNISSFGFLNNYYDKNQSKYVFMFIRILYKRGIISKEEIFQKLQKYSFMNKYINAFFLPEINEMDPKNIELIIRNSNQYFKNYFDFISFIKKYYPGKIDLYEKMLDSFEPDDELTKSLRIDDVDKLQLIITRSEIDISEAVVPYNIFDDLEVNPTLLNYAALYGSVKCFKYLLLNNSVIDENSLFFAVYGGNFEIVKIVDQRAPKILEIPSENYKALPRNLSEESKLRLSKHINGHNFYYTNYSNENNIIASAITMHRNNLFDWIFENQFVNKGKIGDSLKIIASISAINGNAHSLIEIIDKGFDISMDSIVSYSAKNGFVKLTKLLLSIIEQKVKKDDSKSSFDFKSSVHFGNLSLLKLFINKMDQTGLEVAFSYAVQNGYKDIVDYFLDHIIDIKNINKLLVINALKSSLDSQTNEYFNYLMEKFKEFTNDIFDLQLFTKLLQYACSYSNLPVVKTLTDIILKIDPKNDFSSAFISASSSESMNICRFFIEKNVHINYDEFSTQVSELGSIDTELFSMIINKVNPNIKYKFLRCINQAIQNKNKKLIEFLLNENAPIQTALFEAVLTQDVEIVDLILKYNSKPSFVNMITQEGTALHSAASRRDIPIVKRLLSVPGIDPGLVNHLYKTPLTIAIYNYDMNMIEIFLDFYGDNINSQYYYIVKVLFDLTNKYADNKIWKIVKRIFEIKSIDPNICIQQNTLFFKACINDQLNAVKDLLTIENIDVNKYEIDSYNTPLMAAIINKNINISKILIDHPKTNLNFKNIENKSAMHLAVIQNLPIIVLLLLNNERFDPLESDLNYAFYLANAEISNILITSKFLDINYIFELPKYKNEDDDDLFRKNHIKRIVEKTALIQSVEINDIDKIELIVNHPTFNKEKSNIIKAIFVATKKNNIDVFKLLIKLINNDINLHNENNESLLEVAAKNLSGEIIDEIFNNDQFDPKNHEILDAFVRSYSMAINKKRKKSDDDFNTQRYVYQRQQYIYQQRLGFRRNQQQQIQNEQQVLHNELIPAKGSIIDIMNKIYNYDNMHEKLIDFTKLLDNRKSFFTVISKDYDEINDVVDFLINHGVDVNMQDEESSYYPLQHAIKINSIKMINSLLNSNKIIFNRFVRGGATYLHFSASAANDETFKFILEKNIFDINASNSFGQTPLMIACSLCKAGIVDLLFEREDLDYLHCDKNGLDALDSIQVLPQNEAIEAKKNKVSYHKKIISLINNKTSSD